jgi:hypothetical protein
MEEYYRIAPVGRLGAKRFDDAGLSPGPVDPYFVGRRPIHGRCPARRQARIATMSHQDIRKPDMTLSECSGMALSEFLTVGFEEQFVPQ